MKKSLFADEIASGMFNELKSPIVKQASVDLVKAVDYLDSASEILDEIGFHSDANLILDIICKLGKNELDKPFINKESPFKVLMESGLTHKDIVEFTKGNKFAIAKLNKKLRDLDYSDEEIKSLLGKHFMSEKETDELIGPTHALSKIDELIRETLSPSKKEINPGDEISFSSLASNNDDPHTKGLTPEKMVKNLLDHGTEFNMADDGMSHDLLNLEVGDDNIEVSEGETASEMDFEDEI